MIFARRALQRRLNELRAALDGSAVDQLAARLNKPGKDRIAAMWEVVVLHALTRYGTLRNEVPLSSGRRPDVAFDNGVQKFTADITAVSDHGLDSDNPYFELSELVEKEKAKLGLPVGGMDLSVKSKRHRTARGTKTVLLLPPRKKLREFVSEQVIPRLREQMDAGERLLRVEIDDDAIGIKLTIDPSRSPYSSGNFAAYDIPKIKDRNPIYNALKAKASQLRGAKGITGIILGDGDCTALTDRQLNWDEVSAETIAKEFLRQYSSVDFVLFLTIREKRRLHPPTEQAQRWVHPILIARAGCEVRDPLSTLFTEMLREMPKPVMMPANGAMRAREPDYDIGHHGGYTMEGNKIRISSRELIEILSGLRTLEDNGAKFVAAGRKISPKPNRLQMTFLRNLRQGRLPVSIFVIKTDEDDSDDWVEFEFGDPDPAISPTH
jgi:hypothetical protein